MANANLPAAEATLAAIKNTVVNTGQQNKHAVLTGYAGGVNDSIAATPTDVFGIMLTAVGYVAEVRKVETVMTSDTAADYDLLFQRSANIANGTYTNPTVAKGNPFDQFGPVQAYIFTANRTTNGDGISSSRPVIDADRLGCGVSGANNTRKVKWTYAAGKGPQLRHINEALVLNLRGVSLTGTGHKIRHAIHFDLKRVPAIAMVGDSRFDNGTIFNVTNGSNTGGGLGKGGRLSDMASVANLGSNGSTLLNYLLNTGGVATSMLTAQAQGYDGYFMGSGTNDVRTGACSQNTLTALLDTWITGVRRGFALNEVYASPLATSFTITSITWSANVATVTTSAPHGYYAGYTNSVLIAGATPSAYNGYFAVTTVPSTTTFTFALVGDPGGSASSGTVKFAVKFLSAMAATPDAEIGLVVPYGFTGDDPTAGAYMTTSGTLQYQWSGLTLAAAAKQAATIMRNAYRAFVTDARVDYFVDLQMVTQTDPLDRTTTAYAFPSALDSAARNRADVPFVATNARTMTDQIHATTRGNKIIADAIAPSVEAMAVSIAASFVY